MAADECIEDMLSFYVGKRQTALRWFHDRAYRLESKNSMARSLG
jgi:hypothetical protein